MLHLQYNSFMYWIHTYMLLYKQGAKSPIYNSISMKKHGLKSFFSQPIICIDQVQKFITLTPKLSKFANEQNTYLGEKACAKYS